MTMNNKEVTPKVFNPENTEETLTFKKSFDRKRVLEEKLLKILFDDHLAKMKNEEPRKLKSYPLPKKIDIQEIINNEEIKVTENEEQNADFEKHKKEWEEKKKQRINVQKEVKESSNQEIKGDGAKKLVWPPLRPGSDEERMDIHRKKIRTETKLIEGKVWTKNDEKTLQELIAVIESTKKEILALEKELKTSK